MTIDEGEAGFPRVLPHHNHLTVSFCASLLSLTYTLEQLFMSVGRGWLESNPTEEVAE